jgi:cytochrome c biogenesis protein CcmG/thiol:disulfide interchange protein DsbE
MSGDPGSFRSTLAALGLVCALVGGFALLPRVLRSQTGASVGRDAPDITLPVVSNAAPSMTDPGTFRLSELRGHAVLLDFWATWCEPCRLEAPIVEQLSRRWSDRGVVVVGVDTDTPDQGDPARFAVAHGLTYPMVKDDGRASRVYGVDALPTLVVVSRMGKIVAVRSGMTDDAELDRLVRQAL